MPYIIHTTNGSELYHHGIKGQKWGVRRFQNPDGTLTEAGKQQARIFKQAGQVAKNSVVQQTSQKIVNKTAGVDKKKEDVKAIAKTILKGAAIAAATTILANELSMLGDAGIALGKKAVPAAISALKSVDWKNVPAEVAQIPDAVLAKKYGWY